MEQLKTILNNRCVSTVCVFDRYGDFETMIFACDESGKVVDYFELYCDRYSTEDEARKGHARAVALVERGEIDDRVTYDEED